MLWEPWYRGKSFTTDWTTHNFAVWAETLAELRERPVAVLEVGSWEGRSAIFFLEYLPLSSVTCIDTFAGGSEHSKRSVAGIEKRFDANLAAYAGRVRKIKGRSASALDALVAEGSMFDVIYIDGSHRRDDVLVDSLLAWHILNSGGILIWDDYLWNSEHPVSERPQQAIDVFLALHEHEWVRRQVGAQMIVQKTDTRAAREAG